VAFETFRQEGIFSDYLVYSYLKQGEKHADHLAALKELFETTRDYKPDIIFIQNMDDRYPVDRHFLQSLKSISSAPKLIFNDGDPYGIYIGRLGKTQKALCAEADLVLLTGLGYLAEAAIKAGARRVRLLPDVYDTKRFGTEWLPTVTRQYDVVMIGNSQNLWRLPGLYLPGGRKRKQTARLLYRAFGKRFAVFGTGSGWKGEPYCKGTIPFRDQEKYIRSSWVSVGWDHFNDIAMYSSNRVPISLAAGVPHITNYQPGYENCYYSKVPGLFVVKTPRDAADVAMYLLSLTPDERNELGAQAAEYARNHLEATVMFRKMIEVIKEQILSIK